MRDLARRSLAEFIGTFFLVLIGVGAIAVNADTGALGHVGVTLAFVFAVASMVYATGHVSGGHLNPAVTLAFAWVGRSLEERSWRTSRLRFLVRSEPRSCRAGCWGST